MASESVSDDERDAIFLELKESDIENNTCVDCGSKDPEWGSATLAVFICIECSGQHRGWGTHISFVRSCLLDNWTRGQLHVMKAGGNSKMKRFLKRQGFPSTFRPEQRYSSPVFDLYRKALLEGRDVAKVPVIGFTQSARSQLSAGAGKAPSGIVGFGSDSASSAPNEASATERNGFVAVLFAGLLLQLVCGLFPFLLGLSVDLPARAAALLAVVYFVGAELFCRSPGAKAVGDVQQLALNTFGQTVCRIVPLLGIVWRLPFSFKSLQASFLVSLPFFVIMCFATALRWYAMVLMGNNFSRSLCVTDGQHIIKTGPYAYVRHPGYLGNGLMFVASGIVISGNFLVGLICLLAFALAWHPRMQDEEAMLLRALPVYIAYRNEVRYRLVPLVY